MDQKRFPDQLIETIRDRNDLVAVISDYLALKRSGQNYTGLCPFHQEKTPSFVVSPSKQIFHCFGCGVGGNVFQFLIKIEGLSFPEVLRRLAEKGGIPLPALENAQKENPARREMDEIYLLNEEVAAHFHRNLLNRPEAAQARAYLKGRGITAETIALFSIGFALPRRDDLLGAFSKKFSLPLLEKAGLIFRKGGEPFKIGSQANRVGRPSTHGLEDYDPQEVVGGRSGNHGVPLSSEGAETGFDRFRNRILFPIRTLQGKVVGFGGRVLDDSLPKYLNTPETPVFTKGKHLFGLDRAKGKGIHSLIIVEGYFDAIAAHQAGIPNAVATLGTALTQDHLHLISRVAEKVVLIFDPDEAGVRAALRAAPLFIEKEISAEVVSLPLGEDPDLFIRKHGKEGFLKKMTEGKTLIDFSISKWAQSSSSQSINDKKKAMGNIFPLLNILKSTVEQSHYLKTLSEELGVKEEDLRAEFAKQTKTFRSGIGSSKKEGSFPERTTAAAKKMDRLPSDEKTLLCLLLQGQLDPSVLNNRLYLEDFTDPEAKDIASRFWDPQRSQWSPNGAGTHSDSGAEEESNTLFHRLTFPDSNDITQIIEDYPKTIEDSIISLQAKRLGREASEVQRKLKLAEKGGDLAVDHPFQKRFLDLKIKKSAI